MERRVKVVNLSDTLKLPAYATEGSAGLDLPACFDNREKRVAKIYRKTGNVDEQQLDVNSVINLAPMERAIIPTNIKCELAEGTLAFVPSRSGLSSKQGCIVANSPGTVDEDYRGIIHICVINLGFNTLCIRHGDAISQMIILAYDKVSWEEVSELSGDTERGVEGFGSTGVSRA